MKNMSEISSNNLLLSSHEINSLLKKTVYINKLKKVNLRYLLVLDIQQEYYTSCDYYTTELFQKNIYDLNAYNNVRDIFYNTDVITNIV